MPYKIQLSTATWQACVLQKLWDTYWILCRTVISGISSSSEITVFYPLVSPFLHSHFLPSSYLSFKVLDRLSNLITDSWIKIMVLCPGSYGKRFRYDIFPLLSIVGIFVVIGGCYSGLPCSLDPHQSVSLWVAGSLPPWFFPLLPHFLWNMSPVRVVIPLCTPVLRNPRT